MKITMTGCRRIGMIILSAVALALPAWRSASAAEPADTTAAAAPAEVSPMPEDVAALVAEADEYCAGPFLQMDQTALEKLKMQLSDKDWPEALAARDKVSSTLSLWHEIDGYRRLLYVPFQYDKVGRARARIYQMQDEMTPAQYDDIYEHLDSPLSRYYHGVRFFREVLIERFNASAEEARKSKNISEVRRIFTELIKEPEVKDNIEKRIVAVPWLNKKFQDYYTYIMNRQSSPRGPVVQEIMKISLEPGQ